MKPLKTLYYFSDGTMKSTDEEIDNDINIKLNLNCNTDAVTLRENRKAVLNAVQADILVQDGDFYKNCLEQLYMWENESDPKTPYSGIAIWWLRKQIKGSEGEKEDGMT